MSILQRSSLTGPLYREIPDLLHAPFDLCMVSLPYFLCPSVHAWLHAAHLVPDFYTSFPCSCFTRMSTRFHTKGRAGCSHTSLVFRPFSPGKCQMFGQSWLQSYRKPTVWSERLRQLNFGKTCFSVRLSINGSFGGFRALTLWCIARLGMAFRPALKF